MSTESSQKWFERNRPPRVQISYDVETGGASTKRELPMVVGILADLGGTPGPLAKRRFIEIDRDNFDKVMKKIGPNMDIKGIDGLSGNIAFEKLEHFGPDHLVKHVTGLADLFKQRQELRDLMAKIDGNTKLHNTLADAMKTEPTFATWGVQLPAGGAARPALGTLAADAVGALTAEAFAQYNDDELGALRAEQLAKVSKPQLEALKERKPFTKEQIGALSADLQNLLQPKD
jgi:type VI secretion system protein ImpB